VSGSTVYAGGAFTQIGCISGCSITGGPFTRNRLAAIDSNGSLQSWNPNADGTVRALAVSGTNIYAGGDFTTIGSTTRNYLAAIGTDGSLQSWNPNANSSVNALAVSGSTVYAGGQFTSIGGQARSRIVSLNADGSVNW
jgi:outer membrane protein assembly factor BamB